MRTHIVLCLCSVLASAAPAQTPISEAKRTAIGAVRADEQKLIDLNQKVWELAEIGLQEHQSAKILVDSLRSEGFEIQTGVSGMPTAFVASYGSGSPVIGILAEYDALPGMSQKPVDHRAPLKPGAAGHACGHSGLGAAAVGAVVGIKRAIERHELGGTIRLYGTPAEETGIGKVYMLLDGQFDDLDACLHWHPSDKNQASYARCKAVVSVKFRFSGLPAHASVSPEQGRSALDGVELMNVGVNYMREHVKEDARMHYVVTNGGGQPNVVPGTAEVWYYVRANDHRDVERYYHWVCDIARGAALMSRTKLQIDVQTDNHELIPNLPLSLVIQRNFDLVGAPKFTPEERTFARSLQAPLVAEFGSQFDMELAESVLRLATSPDQKNGSTDVGDISWHVPTSGLGAACFVHDSPGHSWQNVATIGSSIGHKGMIVAAKVLAATGVDLLEDPALVAQAKQDFRRRMKDRKYNTLIPDGQKAPKAIR